MDRRVRKSREAIKKALLIMLKREELQQISVKTLTEIADVNRKTFYNHFFDIYSVLDAIEGDITHVILTRMAGYDYTDLSKNPTPFLKEITEELNANEDFNHLFIHPRLSNRILSRIKRTLKDELTTFYRNRYQKDPTAFSFALSFVISGALDTYQEWFHSDRSISLETLTENISSLIAGGIRSTL